jgi:hypothetical protein
MSRLQISDSGSSPGTARRFHRATATPLAATLPLLLLILLCNASAIRSQSAAIKAAASHDATPAADPAALQSSPGESAKAAEQVYKNIEVLKGVPAGQVILATQFVTASLGVECSYCHV